VVETQNTIADNEYNGKVVKRAALPAGADPLGLGNHVVIDHGDGEYSVLLHLERGSVRVRPGEIIKRGDLIGNVGFSGDATYPHLHYAVMNGTKNLVGEGVPSYFNDYKLYRGAVILPVKRSRIDSGDIVESNK
jgi:murein DD-endopeptidase MepM/ murein hydrolase activator NlpD